MTYCFFLSVFLSEISFFFLRICAVIIAAKAAVVYSTHLLARIHTILFSSFGKKYMMKKIRIEIGSNNEGSLEEGGR